MCLHVGHISTFPPTQCGLATYVSDLIRCQPSAFPLRVRLVYPGDQITNDSRTFSIAIPKGEDYVLAAAALNQSRIHVISLQHEFGIFGGPDGAYVTDLVSRLRIPLVTTFHTVYANMTLSKRRIISMLASASKHIVTLTEESKEVLVNSFAIPQSKITVIHHGIPEIKFISPEANPLRKRLGLGPVFVSAGHIKPKKGHDMALRALMQLRDLYPDFKYLIVGSPQPQFDHESGYEAHLDEAIARENLRGNVVRINQYLSTNDFIATIQAADIGLVTYSSPFQNSSGILPLILGCGRPVIATDFQYAKSIATRAAGVFLVKINDSTALLEILSKLLCDFTQLRNLMLATYHSAQAWNWPKAAEAYMSVFKNFTEG